MNAASLLQCTFGCVVAGAVALIGCKQKTEPPPVAPEVEIGGCSAWLDGPICELGAERSLRVWAGAPAVAIELHAAGAIVAPLAARSVEGGTLWSLTVPSNVDALELTSAPPGHGVLYRVGVRSAPSYPRIAEAQRRKLEGKRDEALQLLADIDQLSGDERAAAHALRARLLLSTGAVEASLPEFREAIERRPAPRASDRVIDAAALAFALSQRSYRFAEATQVLTDAALRARGYPWGQGLVAYHQALVSYETGDMRETLRGLEEAALHSARTGDAPLLRSAKQVRALALLSLGRRREAIDILTSLRVELGAATDCLGADLAINLSWGWASCADTDSLALCGVSSELALRKADEAAKEAIATFPDVCPDPHLTANALVNDALVHLLEQDAEGTLALLARSRERVERPSASVELFWIDLESRARLARGETERALAGFEQERAMAASLLVASMQWRAEVGIADARERTGDVRGALAAYDRAAVAAEEESLSIPLGEGRVTFLAEREQVTVRHVALLLRRKREADALAVVRRARLSVLQPLEWARRFARLDPTSRRRWDDAVGSYRLRREELESSAAAEWRLPKAESDRSAESRKAKESEVRKALDLALSVGASAHLAGPPASLRHPGPGELLLVYHYAGSRWIGFADTQSGVSVHDLGDIDADASASALAATLLSPFGREIDASKRVLVLATGSLRGVDFHALPWHGEPLIMRASIAYGLDLAAKEPSAEDSGGGPDGARALVVGDPRGDLLEARAEALATSAKLRESGWTVETRIQRDARGGVIRDSLPNVELLHYAGHGAFSGPDGWQSALPLADSGSLSVSDLLALPHVPRLVVLAGCETGRSSDAKGAAGLGLAQAFLVAGAEQVLASGRRVSDAMVQKVMAMLYSAPPSGGRTDLVERLAEAQRTLFRQGETTGWQDLRVLVR